MKNLLSTLIALVFAGAMGSAGAAIVTLVAHNQVSDSGTPSTLVWNGANAANSWAIANGVTASTATWDWNAGTGVLTSTGRFESTSHVGSNPAGLAVVDDRVVNLVIDTVNSITTATSYNCIEGNFLVPFIGVHGCANVFVQGDDNITYDGSVAYNVGGNANCLQRTIGGDDINIGNPRGLSALAASGGCDATNGAFNLYTVTTSGNQLILSNGIPFNSPGANFLTFQTQAVVPVPAAVWLFGSAIGLLGLSRRRR